MIVFFDIETVSDESVNREKHIDRYAERINFMWEFNKICCISLAYKNSKWDVVSTTYSGEENEIITKFFDAVENNRVCWYNVKWFDIPFIVKRAIKHGIQIPFQFKAYWKKPWEIDWIIDLQEVWKHIWMNTCSLEVLCEHLGIKSSKQWEIHGANVQEAFNNWRIKEICEYCEDDVRATVEVYERLKSLNFI